MSWVVVLLLVGFWGLSLLKGYSFGGLIHILIVYAGLILVTGLIERRRFLRVRKHSEPVVGNLALEAAKEFLAQRGNSPRIYQNTVVFLAADRSRLDGLEQAARYYLAWQSITEQETELNVDKSQSRQAATQKGTWDRTTTSRIGETFQWLMVPTQPNPQAAVEWQQTRLTGADALAVRASRKLKSDGQMEAERPQGPAKPEPAGKPASGGPATGGSAPVAPGPASVRHPHSSKCSPARRSRYSRGQFLPLPRLWDKGR